MIGSFLIFSNEEDARLHKQLKEHFLINDKWVMETMNNSYDIIESRRKDGADEYLVQTESKKYYKIYVEDIYNGKDMYIDVGFLRHIGGDWTASGIINDLTSTELLTLFGTLKKIVLKYDVTRIYIGTNDELNKMIKYMKILNRIDMPGYKMTHDENDDFCLSKDYQDTKSFMNSIISFKNKFKNKG
jgi:hypothetical protein